MREPSPRQPRDATLEERLWSRVDTSGECWNWTAGKVDGYGHMRLPGGKNMALTHRVSYTLHHGPIPEGLMVLHSCDNRACVNPAHLRVGTMQDNANDMKERGRQCRGEQKHSAKLTPKKVRTIRVALADGASPISQATRFGVDCRTIRSIRDGETWAWLD